MLEANYTYLSKSGKTPFDFFMDEDSEVRGSEWHKV